MKTGKLIAALLCIGVVPTGLLLAGDACTTTTGTAGTAVKTHRVQQKQETTAHVQQQKCENKTFQKDLKGVTGTNRTAAIVGHRETQYQENKTFAQTQHTENMAVLNERLAKNKNLTDAQKTELSTFFESQYQENVSFRDTQHTENIAYFESVANDTSLTMDQKKAKLKTYFTTQKSETKSHVQTQQAERTAERDKIKSEIQVQKVSTDAAP